MNSPNAASKHLIDDELISILYEEGAPQSLLHMERCDECKNRLTEFKAARNLLDPFVGPIPEIDASRMTDAIFANSMPTPSESNPVSETPVPFGRRANSQSHQSSSGISFSILASVAILIFAIGFFAGGWIQSRAVRQFVDHNHNTESNRVLDSKLEKLEKSFAQIFENRDQATELDLLKDQLGQINETLVRLESPESRSAVFLRFLEDKIAKIQSDQGVLRKDIQTMAINAEKEINLTRNDVQRLTNVVEYLLPVLH